MKLNIELKTEILWQGPGYEMSMGFWEGARIRWGKKKREESENAWQKSGKSMKIVRNKSEHDAFVERNKVLQLDIFHQLCKWAREGDQRVYTVSIYRAHTWSRAMAELKTRITKERKEKHFAWWKRAYESVCVREREGGEENADTREAQADAP